METVDWLYRLFWTLVGLGLSGLWLLGCFLGVCIIAKVLEDMTEMLIGKDTRK